MTRKQLDTASINRKTLNLDALKSFVVFADTLNFTHAAELLNISQPALHVKVQDLAESLGVPLYRRVGRSLELTAHGRKVARFGREMAARADNFLDELATGETKQPIVLAAGEGAFRFLLGDAISEFIRHRYAPLKLLTANREGVIDALESGKAHIGVSTLDSIPHGMQAHLLCKVGQMLVLNPQDQLASYKRIRLKDLAGAKLIVPPQDRPHRQLVSTALQSAGIQWEVAVEASGWELMMHFVKLGLGMAIVNSCCAVPKGLIKKPRTSSAQPVEGRRCDAWQRRIIVYRFKHFLWIGSSACESSFRTVLHQAHYMRWHCRYGFNTAFVSVDEKPLRYRSLFMPRQHLLRFRTQSNLGRTRQCSGPTWFELLCSRLCRL